MTTLPNDFCRFMMPDGTHAHVRCADIGVEWPPPDLVLLEGPQLKGLYRRERFSQLTDTQADHPNLARGAEYLLAVVDPDTPEATPT
jgi:hypothetical protein